MMKIALFPNVKKNHSIKLATDVLSFFQKKNITTYAEDQEAAVIGATPLSSVDPNTLDFLISIGGDGTILTLSKKYSHLDAAILGINLGHLGFMAEIPVPDLYPSLEDLINGKYKIQKRLMLEGISPEKQTLYAGNDFVIHRSQNHSLIEIAVHVDGNYLNTFLADGLVVATPTGSTAYSLAAGGPIISPHTPAFVITPICAHTISHRPIVLDANSKIELQYLSEYESVNVWADGIEHMTLHTNEKTTIQKSDRKFKLVNLDRHDYFNTLRTKLAWSGKLH